MATIMSEADTKFYKRGAKRATKRQMTAAEIEAWRKRVEKEVAAKNALYDSMTPEQRRVEVAKDVLLQIKAERYKATKGTYVVSKNLIDTSKLGLVKGSWQDQQVCSLVPDGGPTCKVCARGAFLISSMMVFDRLKVRQLENLSDQVRDLKFDVLQAPETTEGWASQTKAEVLRNGVGEVNLGPEDFGHYERQIFTNEQIGLMEAMFEKDATFSNTEYNDIARAAARYGIAFGDSRSRLIEICKNFIRNKGEFIIPAKFFKPVKK